jgi:HAD superfamily hydrolase (TIGR01549 family)
MSIRTLRSHDGGKPYRNDKQWGVLFDLDETLVLTSALEGLRRARNWPAVYGRFAETLLPNGTREFLEELAESALLGVVTKSQRTYAQKLLSHHQIDIPVLVAYHDVRKQKPDPEGLLKAAAKLGLPPERCIYVGDHPDDLVAGDRAHCRPILVCWTKHDKTAPTCGAFHCWEDVFHEIKKITGGGNGEDL